MRGSATLKPEETIIIIIIIIIIIVIIIIIIIIADSIDQIRGGKCDTNADGEAADPRKCHRQAHDPFTQDFLAQYTMNDLQIAFDRNEYEVDLGSDNAAPENILAGKPHT